MDISIKFVKSFLSNLTLTTDVLDQSQLNDIKEAVSLLVSNARVTETRKMQQEFYAPVLEIATKEMFLDYFNNDESFRIKFLQLLIVMLDKNSLHDDEAKHHVFIKKIIKDAALKI